MSFDVVGGALLQYVTAIAVYLAISQQQLRAAIHYTRHRQLASQAASM